ncbi:MAG TPA: hypothetical protein VKL40_04620 [Candidatus Angelobacter sp.]|nr:hypothetical protein [Candidatus Angelobacter sp.]
MRPGTKDWWKRVWVWLAILALLVVFLPRMAGLASIGLSLSLVAIIILGYLVFVVGMPFFAWIMGEAGYKVFLKPYVRAWRINRIRNARYLREALERSKEQSN